MVTRTYCTLKLCDILKGSRMSRGICCDSCTKGFHCMGFCQRRTSVGPCEHKTNKMGFILSLITEGKESD